MAGYVCSVDNKNSLGEFQRLVMPGEKAWIYDESLEANLAKIAILFCLPNNRGTLVYERTIPYEGCVADLERGFGLLSSQRHPRKFDAAVTYLNPHVVALDPSSSQGYTIEHSPFIHDDYTPLATRKIDKTKWHNRYLLPRASRLEPGAALN